MAFLKCFILVTVAAAYANAQQTCTIANQTTDCPSPTYGGTCLGDDNCNCGPGYVRITGSACIALTAPALACTADTTCTDSTAAHVGDTCETLTDATTQQCNCNPANYVRVDGNCVVNHVACNGDTNNNCTGGDPFTGTCPTSNECSCSTGYAAVTSQCKVKPEKPTLSVEDGSGTTVTGDLIHGSSYTLVCSSTGAPGNIPYSYSYTKVGTGSQSESLNTVTQTDNGGSYTCTASYDGVDSVDSEELALQVKPVKPTLREDGGAPLTDLSEGGTYKLDCSSADAPTTTTYTYTKDTTTPTSQDLTSVTTASAAGAYYCIATISGVDSDQSDTVNVAVGAAGTYCTGTSNCNGDSYTGVCTAARCVCASGYEARGTVCSPQPAKPTLKVDGDHNATDLSAGGAYTLVCESADAPEGTTYTFSNGTTAHTGTFAAISTSDNGAYTCVATSGAGVQSAESDALTITVGASGKRCTANSGCTAGNGFTGTCTTTTNRCACSSGYQARGDTCSSAVQAATISVFSILLALVVSKLL